MGYYTRLSGTIKITPPITWREAKDTIWAQQGQREEELTLELNTEVYDTEIEDDVVTVSRKEFTHVRATWEDEQIKAYRTEECLQQIVDAFPGHDFSGYIEGVGEESPDIWRLTVRGGRVVKIEPTITWPNDVT